MYDFADVVWVLSLLLMLACVIACIPHVNTEPCFSFHCMCMRAASLLFVWFSPWLHDRNILFCWIVDCPGCDRVTQHVYVVICLMLLFLYFWPSPICHYWALLEFAQYAQENCIIARSTLIVLAEQGIKEPLRSLQILLALDNYLTITGQCPSVPARCVNCLIGFHITL